MNEPQRIRYGFCYTFLGDNIKRIDNLNSTSGAIGNTGGAQLRIGCAQTPK